jgi:hypothetical protein
MSYQSANAHTSDWFGCVAVKAAVQQKEKNYG